MGVETSISLTEAQDEYARGLVAAGLYADLSAVLQHGLDLLRETADAEAAALRALLEERAAGRFEGTDEARRRTAAMLASKRAGLGLPG